MNVHKIELYVWGINDQYDSTVRFVKDRIEDEFNHDDLCPIFGNTTTIMIPTPVPGDDDYPLNKMDQQLEYARSLFLKE